MVRALLLLVHTDNISDSRCRMTGSRLQVAAEAKTTNTIDAGAGAAAGIETGKPKQAGMVG
jgi:hypothetical protein